MTIHVSEIIKILWKEGFFQIERSFKDIRSAINEKGYNPNIKTLSSTLTRANYLTRNGSIRYYRYIQSHKCPDDQCVNTSKKINNIEILKARGIHTMIIKVSGKLFADEHYSQSIFEAFKVINNMVKEKTGLTNEDGRNLMARAFKPASPRIRWSNLITDSEIDEQEGFMFLFMGAMVGIRNPKAHEFIIQNDKIKTLEYLSFASLLAKRIDESVIVTP